MGGNGGGGGGVCGHLIIQSLKEMQWLALDPLIDLITHLAGIHWKILND